MNHPKQLTNFGFCEPKLYTFWKCIDVQSQTIYVDRKVFKKIDLLLEDGATRCATSDIDQIIIKNLSKIWQNHIELMINSIL